MGLSYCCVKGCSSNTSLINISLFRFPNNDQQRCLAWAKECGREDLQNISPYRLHNNYRVCSLHFEEEMFSSLLKNRLKRNAIPTLFNLNMSAATSPQPVRVPEALEGISENKEALDAIIDPSVGTQTSESLFLTWRVRTPRKEQLTSQVRKQKRKLSQQEGELNKKKIDKDDKRTDANETRVSSRTVCCDNNDILFHGLSQDEEAKKASLNTISQGLLRENALAIYRYNKHFTPDSCQSPTVGPEKTLKNTTVPTLFDHCNDTELIDRSVDVRKCRTCLEVTDAEQCMEVTEKCYSEKTIKETIIILVPEMRSTISDEDRVCETCCGVLKSSMKFIERCLQVELTIAKECKQFAEYQCEDDLSSAQNESKENMGDLVEPQVDLEHNNNDRKTVNGVLVEGSENTQQHNESLTCDSLPLLETIKDEFEADIVIEHCDLLQESEISNNLDPAVDVFEEEVTFSSQTCYKKFSPDDYKLHMETHPEFICEHCGKGFKARLSYTNHLRIHNEQFYMLCDICGKFVKNDLKTHKSSHDKARPYMCHECPKTFKSQRACRQHEKIIHRKISQQQCHECGMTFLTMNRCRAHYRLKHLKLTPFVCHVCGREFGRKDYLQNHMHRHTSEPRLGRDGQVKRGRVNEKLGFRLKHPGKPINCKICGKKISTLSYLRLHLQTHTMIKSYKCRHCNLPFTTSTNRDRHEKSHEVDHENKFRCNICWKRTKTEEDLEVHLRVHEKRPPKYSCGTCGEKFYREYLLNNHCISKHLSPEDIEKAEKEIIVQNLLEYADTDY